jgi:hypothetical protein
MVFNVVVIACPLCRGTGFRCDHLCPTACFHPELILCGHCHGLRVIQVSYDPAKIRSYGEGSVSAAIGSQE